MKEKIGTIDLTPTWSGVLDLLLMAYTQGTVEGQRHAIMELQRMAQAADAYVTTSDILRRERIEKLQMRRLDAFESWKRLSDNAAHAFDRVARGPVEGPSSAVFRSKAAQWSAQARQRRDEISVIDNELRELGA